jgi:hypothetical protein
LYLPATKINIIVRIFCYLRIYLFFTKIFAIDVWRGRGGWEFHIPALGLKLAGYDSEEKHGRSNADFHETRTC